MSGDPRRLIEDPTTPLAARDDLRAAKDAPLAYDVERGVSAFERALEQGAPPAPPSRPWVKIAAAGGGGIAAIAIVATMLARGASPATPPPSPAPVAVSAPTPIVVEAPSSPAGPSGPTPSSPAGPSGPTLSSPAVEAPAPEAAPITTSAPPAPTASLHAARKPRAADADRAALEREMRRLAEARTALASDPARALQLAERGQREFVHGFYAEEWEALVILSMVRTGRVAESRGRASSFAARHPRSPFNERIRKEIDAASSKTRDR